MSDGETGANSWCVCVCVQCVCVWGGGLPRSADVTDMGIALSQQEQR